MVTVQVWGNPGRFIFFSVAHFEMDCIKGVNDTKEVNYE